MSTTLPTVSVDLSLSWGSILAGTFASLILYGVSILQTFIYYVQYPKDRMSLKFLVVAVFLLDTLHQFLACAGVWSYLVQYYGDFANLVVMHPPLLLATVVTSLVSFTVQSFFVWRIWSWAIRVDYPTHFDALCHRPARFEYLLHGGRIDHTNC
ncbi:hypothetical protein EDC04DRAFT_682803 [Pisolithus marmoratus]|nr:hypothetical protein EDC04DRAFT_682803 [Pisolithus marmoratus]